MAEIRVQGKQIRCIVSKPTYDELIKKSKQFGLTLSQYAGLKLGGMEIVSTNNEK